MLKFMLVLTVVAGAASAFASTEYPSQCKISIDSTEMAKGEGVVTAKTNGGTEYTCKSTFNSSSILSMTMTQGQVLVAETQNIRSSQVSTVILENGQPVSIECTCAMPETVGM